jgi:hypothetical protein
MINVRVILAIAKRDLRRTQQLYRLRLHHAFVFSARRRLLATAILPQQPANLIS